MLKFEAPKNQSSIIKVIGVGGGWCTGRIDTGKKGGGGASGGSVEGGVEGIINYEL